MTNPMPHPKTLSDIAVVMFAVADQDAALAFYTDKLGFEVRGDSRFGKHGEMRWLEVAPPGSRVRLALNPPTGGQPGGGSIGVATADVVGEHARLRISAASTSTRSPCAFPTPHCCSCCATPTATPWSW